MSRIGKQPISIPDKVTVTLNDGQVIVKGPLGTLTRTLHPSIAITADAKTAMVTRVDDSAEARSIHGLYRILVNNMVVGVSQGFQKILDLVGVGYRAEVKGSAVVLTLGYSHPIEYVLPTGVKAAVEKQTRITVSGADNELVGEVAAQLRRFRPPEPYKGKGVRYVGEVIRKKVGKAAAGASSGGK